MKINELLRVCRANEWFPDVFLWYMAIILLTKSFVPVSFDTIVLFAAYHFIMLSYCYQVNSFADLAQDTSAGKKNIFTRIGKGKRNVLVITSSGLVAVLPLLLFKGNVLIIILAYLNLFLSAFYSLRPLRFKERGLPGLIVASLIQGPLAYLLFAYYAGVPFVIYIGFLLWIFFLEASDDLTHQISDYLNDKKADVTTFVTVHGMKEGVALNKFLLLLCSLIPLMYLFEGVYQGIFITVFLGAFVIEKFEHSKTQVREMLSLIRKRRGSD